MIHITNICFPISSRQQSTRLFLVLFLLGTTSIAFGQELRSFQTNGTHINIETFNNEVNDMMENLGVPGLSLAIIENNQLAFYETYGVKKSGDSETVQQETVFNGCSLSKSFLVFVVMQLVDEGKLDLDKPIYQYLGNDALSHDSRYKSITSRMILSHSSGIENWQYDHEPSVLEIVSTPGDNYVYSGEGYNYLAKVVEGLLGKSYEEYIHERVVSPLALSNTHLKYKREKINESSFKLFPSNYATGHGVFSEHVLNTNYDPNPAAGVHFTAADYAKLIISIFDTSHVSVERLADIQEPLTPIYAGINYGAGFQVIESGDDVIIAHGGNNPGYKNWMFYSLKHRRGIVIMTNSDRGELMVHKLSNMSVGLELDVFVNSWFGFSDQYPGNATKLFKVFNEQGDEAMFASLEGLAQKDQLQAKSLSTLSYLFLNGGDMETSGKLLNYSITHYPDAYLAYFFLGMKLYYEGNPTTALGHFQKAKELGFELWDLNFFIQECQKLISKEEANGKMPRGKQ